MSAMKASSTRDSENTEVIKCPKCGKAMWISRKVNGQSVQCPHCAHVTYGAKRRGRMAVGGLRLCDRAADVKARRGNGQRQEVS